MHFQTKTPKRSFFRTELVPGLASLLLIALNPIPSLGQTLDSMDHSSQFRQLIQLSQEKCPNLRCENSPLQVMTVSRKQATELNQQTRNKITAICQTIAEKEWPETILDGPYVANFKVHVSRIEELTYSEGLFGYRVTYTDQAWKIDQCNYDPRNKESLWHCENGIFLESAFISAITGESFRDPEAEVKFISLKKQAPN